MNLSSLEANTGLVEKSTDIYAAGLDFSDPSSFGILCHELDPLLEVPSLGFTLLLSVLSRLRSNESFAAEGQTAITSKDEALDRLVVVLLFEEAQTLELPDLRVAFG